METSNIAKRIGYYLNPKHIDPKMVKLWTFWIILNVVLWMIPQSVTRGSILIFVPLAGLFVYALTTKDVMSSLIMGTLSMYILWYKGGFLSGFMKDTLTSLADKENIEMYMSFFLCGGIIIAMKRSGATNAFTKFVTSHFGKNEKAILVTSGIYAGATSIDDYVSALTAGAAFSPLIDAIKKPRLALAYVIRTLCINVSELLPVGAWGYFVVYQIAAAKNVPNRAAATHIFIQTIPFMFYAIVACVVAMLFAVGIVPKIGKMKEAYRLMDEEGVQMGALTDGSEKEEEDYDPDNPRTKYCSVLNLVLPIVCIVVALIASGLDCFVAFMVATVFTGILYVVQGLFTIQEYVQCLVDGFIDMTDMVIILMIGYIMQNVMYSMGMESFVHTVLGGIPIVKLIPFILFAFFSCTEYLYSLNYTLYQIAIPVLMVVLTKIGANVPLCLGALISAGLFGANACVVSDLGVISARACRVKIYEQYETSLPYFVISAVITGVLYLIAGFVF